MMKNKEPLLKVQDLSIEFHDHFIPETVVNHFNLELYPGEIMGIVGESGSGKSMSALAIAGLLRRKDMKKQGKILFEGVDLLSCDRKELRKIQGKDMGIIFQEPMTSLNPVKKVGWQIEETLRIHTELKKRERYDRVIEMMNHVELHQPERLYHQYPHQLSGGMRQRVMIASAMICEPRLLIADEPTTALDVTVQEQILNLIKRMNREMNTAILFISHDLSVIRKLCESVIVMKEGNIVEKGRVEDIFRRPEKEYTRDLIGAIPEIFL